MTFAFDIHMTRYIANARREQAQNLRHTRFLLLRRLRLASVAEVVCTYDGYGDSGNWEDVVLDGGAAIPSDELQDAIGNFTWDVAYHHHSGFENNEGAFGEMIWDTLTDSITLDHSERFVDTHQSFHEGI